MKRNIWIWNHYATNMYKDQAGRHYWFAENLIKAGYNPTIFCASTVHNSNENIDTKKEKYIADQVNSIPFVFVKAPDYDDNGKKRFINMLAFYRNLFPVAKEYAKIHGKPDIILASSVHPLTLVAGIKIAKKFGVPCICEVRDLWPESIVAYGNLNRNSIIAKILYQGEKWIYKKADKLIFTMEGGKDYIIKKGWDNENGGPIDICKIHHINNGVDLKSFIDDRENYAVEDDDLEDEDTFKVVYTGSIRKVNNVGKIVKTADYIDKKGIKNVKFIIFGDGNDREYLEKHCVENKIDNVVFKGFVDKKRIPYILSKSNLNIMIFDQNS
ncbi:MAG: glycosyltransferase family 4 protein, partial [Ruminiclostridium sp.]|nr:glycosyltransferase family 4 protein [Ruminiclostridium sp.]